MLPTRLFRLMSLAVPEFQLTLTRLAAHLGSRVGALLARMDRLTFHEALAFITDAYPDMVAPYAAAAADLTARWYNEQPTTGRKFTATAVPAIPADRLAVSGRWALTQPAPTEALQGSAQRAVFDASRQTVLTNAVREPGTTFARHASANACSFCRVLATAGAVYQTATSAERVVGRTPSLSTAAARAGVTVGDEVAAGRLTYNGAARGKANIGDKYHDHCHCVAVAVRPGDTYEPPPYVAQWKQEYKDAIKRARVDGIRRPDLKDIVRQLDKEKRVAAKVAQQETSAANAVKA